MKNKTKTQKTYFLAEICGGDKPKIEDAESVFTTKEEALENCSGGDFVYEVKLIKKYKVIDASVKLVEIK